MTQQIILRKLQRPAVARVYEDIDWLGESFGFNQGRDTQRVSAQLLHSILQDVSRKGLTSTERLSDELDLAVQRVNYHIRTLIEGGFLYREKKCIYVREGSVKAAVEEIRRDANRIFDDLSAIAENIDAKLGLKNR